MKILFLDSAHPSLKKELEKNGFACEQNLTSSKKEIQEKISVYDGIVIRSRMNIDKEFIDRLASGEQRKFIARVGAGMEHIDVEYAKAKGVQCISSPEGNRNAVAEHALGMLLALLNNLAKADKEVREGNWLREPNRGTELEGKVVGVYGYGNTGSAFAKLLKGFDVKILVYDKYKKGFGARQIKESTPEELFSEADVLSLHLPLTEETKYLADDAFIKKFRKHIYLVNTSRGQVVKTDDLVKGLQSGKILGACLDVLEYEEASFEGLTLALSEAVPVGRQGEETVSPAGRPGRHQPATSGKKPETLQYLLNSQKVILTPHIAGWSHESGEKMARILAEKITAWWKPNR